MIEQGHVIADYTVIRPLAENKAYQGYLVSSGAGEAKLLQIKDSAEWSRSRRQAFYDQIHKLLALELPTACLPVFVTEEQGELFCVYQLPFGTPISSLSKTGFSARTAVELVCAIAALLEPAHDRQLFHGNLSPRTVYLDQGNKPCLDAFALCSLVLLDYQSGVEAEYLSPEQVRGESAGTAADIYSLGCLFYSLLIGKPPFSGSDPFSVGLQHLNGSFPDLPTPLTLCSELLTAMTAPSTNARYSARQVREHAEHLLGRDEIDQILPLYEDEPAPLETIASEAVAMAPRIEEQLRKLEAGCPPDDLHDPSLPQEEFFLAPAAARPNKLAVPYHRFLFFAVGLVVGLCLGALGFDFFFAGSAPDQTSRVYPLATVPPDYDKAMAFLLNNDLDAAERDFHRLLTHFPETPQLYNNLAAVAAARGDVELAREWLEQAIVLEEETATIYRNLGILYAEMARDSYGRALQLDRPSEPIFLDVFSNQGVLAWSGRGKVVVAGAETSSAAEQQGRLTVPGAALTEPVVVEDGSVAPAVQPVAPVEPESRSEAADADSVAAIVTKPSVAPASAPAAAVSGLEWNDPRDNPETFLRRWAEAWSAQDIEGYLSFYAEDFVPSSGLSREAWVRQRRERLTRPGEISVNLEDFELRSKSDDRLEIEVLQGYRSERYSDHTRKLFELRYQDRNWTIYRERSLELLRQ